MEFDSRRKSQFMQIISIIFAGDLKQLRIAIKDAEILKKRTRELRRTVLIEVAGDKCTHKRYTQCIELILNLGADPAAFDSNDDTAAHVAARCGNLRMLALLPFEAKFLLNKAHNTPLMEAVQNCQFQCAKHLLHLFRQDRYFNQKENLLSLRNKQGLSVLDLAKAIGPANKAEEMVAIIETESRLIVTRVAGRVDSYKIIGLSNDQKHQVDEMKRLVIEGKYIELQRVANCDLPDKSGRTVLSWAVAPDKTSPLNKELLETTLTFLVTIGDPTATDVNGDTSLHYAALHSQTHAVKILVEQGGVPVNSRDAYGQTPLMWAATSSNPSSKSMILTLANMGADWTLSDCEGRTAQSLSTSGTSNPAQLALLQTQMSGTRRSHNFQRDSSAVAYNSLTASSNAKYSYVLNEASPGLMLIINVHDYKETDKFDSRIGSKTDVKSLKELAAELKFDILESHDETAEEIKFFLKDVAENEAKLQQHSCLVCVIMAHGKKRKIVASDGVELSIDDIVKKFNSSNCPAMKHKPKVFVIQACRGRRMDVHRSASCADIPPRDSARNLDTSSYCPVESDILICYSATEGSAAYRGQTEQEGSPFIQTLCSVIKELHGRHHLVEMLTILNGRLKDNPIRSSPQGFSYYVVPQTVTQLTKFLYL